MKTMLLASVLALSPCAALAQSGGTAKLDGLSKAKKADSRAGAKVDGISRARKAPKASAAHKSGAGIIGPSDSRANRAYK